MKYLIEEYGNVLVAVMTGGLCLMVLVSSFMNLWQEHGGVDDSIKTNFESNEVKRTPPVLVVTDFKIRQGEQALFSGYVSAIDYDGRDITSEVEAQRVEGGERDVREEYENLLGTYGKTVWKQAGVLRFLLRVRSPVTGKETKGKLVVLVDSMPGGISMIDGNETHFERNRRRRES